MIILRKKKIAFICCCIIVSTFTFLIANENMNKKENAIPTVSLPVSNKVIVIDAGHGVPDERS